MCLYPLAIKKQKQKCMHFVEEHRFGRASALHDCADEMTLFFIIDNVLQLC